MEDKNRIVIALLEELSKTQCGLNDLNQESARHFADMYTQIGGSAYPYLHVEEISH